MVYIGRFLPVPNGEFGFISPFFLQLLHHAFEFAPDIFSLVFANSWDVRTNKEEYNKLAATFLFSVSSYVIFYDNDEGIKNFGT